MFLWLYVYVFLCFIISIHSKDIHLKITSSFCKFLCFMYYTFNMCHIFIGCTLGLFLNSDFFILFLIDWLASTWSKVPSSESVKNIASKVDLLKPRLHASWLPWMEIWLWWQHGYYLETVSRIINFVLHDMGMVNISRKMLKNPHVDEKTKNNIQKCPPVKGKRRKIVEKKSQLTAPKKWG